MSFDLTAPLSLPHDSSFHSNMEADIASRIGGDYRPTHEPPVDQEEVLTAEVVSSAADSDSDSEEEIVEALKSVESSKLGALNQREKHSDDTMSYVHGTGLPLMFLDFLTSTHNETVAAAIGLVCYGGRLQELITNLNMMKDVEKSVGLAFADHSDKNGKWKRVPPIKVDTSIILIKMDVSNIDGKTNHFSTRFAGESIQSLESDTHCFVKGPDPVSLPTVLVKYDDKEITCDGIGMQSAISVFFNRHNNTLANKAKRGYTPDYMRTTAEYYATLVKRIGAVGKFATLPHSNLVTRVAALDSEYQNLNPGDITLTALQPLTKIAAYRAFVKSEAYTSIGTFGDRYDSMRNIDAMMKGLGRHPVIYTALDLENDRKFRDIVSVKDACKEPDDAMSMKLRGVQPIKKFVVPLLEIAHVAKGFIATGHSDTNNWEQLLRVFGAYKAPGEISGWEEWINSAKFVPIALLPTRATPSNPKHAFLQDLGVKADAQFVEKFGTLPKEPVKNGKLVFVSDVFVHLKKVFKKPKQAEKDEYVDNIVEYCQILMKMIDKGHIVIAKFVPRRTTISIARNLQWDWDLYFPLHFQGYYIKAYGNSRMHNGEVVLMMSKDLIKGVAEEKWAPDHFQRLSSVIQARMSFSNSARNYMLAWGIPVLPRIPPLTAFSLRFIGENHFKQWIEDRTTNHMASVSVNINASKEEIATAYAQQMEAEKARIAEKKVKSDSARAILVHRHAREKNTAVRIQKGLDRSKKQEELRKLLN